MKITETKGDLFEAAPASDGLVHCVSQDLHMGKGIATEFKKQFGGTGELASQNKQVGQVAVLNRPPRGGIFYLITKSHYYKKPSLASLRATLVELKKICDERGVKSLSMPRIGCGLDKLRWGDVSALLEDVFKDSDMDIHVFYL